MVLKRDNSQLSHGASFSTVHTIHHSNNSLQFNIVSFLKRRFVARKLLAFFREYSATIVVAVCVLLTALLNLNSDKSSKGSLFDTLGFRSNEGGMNSKGKLLIMSQKGNSLATAPLADPTYLTSENYLTEEIPTEEPVLYTAPTIQNQVLLASYNPVATSANGRESKNYIIKEGDTIGSIAARHGVSANTLLWANDLTDTSIIKPGDKLTVLPVTGIRYKVQKGDSLAAIVNKFNADKQKVLAYNQLPADEKLKDGQDLILPDGYVSTPSAPATAGSTRLATTQAVYKVPAAYGTAVASSVYKMDSAAGGGHRFPYGYCTWYVAQRKYVPWGGNAGAWIANARASGRATGRAPKAGSIIVTGESRWGHVGIVEKVNGSTVTISEMNYAGFGRKSTRTLNANSRVIKGFIY